ncbi:MAG: 3-hydroxyacyl-CoA dehydrogenase NAD-binding domain-containing protein [Gemmatimonadaceae bacterium]
MPEALQTIGVVGAGAMGTGIAQLAAVHGHAVVLADTDPAACHSASARISAALEREVAKGRLTGDAAATALSRLTFAGLAPAGDAALSTLARCMVVIEAVAEQLDAKRALFQQLDAIVQPDSLLATNTSSLAVTAIAAACRHPERTLGVHFFNPATVMPLVEIVPGARTGDSATLRARSLVQSWGKTAVVARDTPGFIVNRVARPYYGEALRLLDEGIAEISDIDWAMTQLGGFRMGPFELMDFIGHDVNYVVTESVWRGLYFDPRYQPSLTQRRLLEAGMLGKKSGRGFYDYSEGSQRPAPKAGRALGEAIVRRILAMLINEAVDAVHLKVASVADIELAMTKGVNYPKGLLAWGDELGLATVLGEIDRLHEEYREPRYRASPLLRRMVREGRTFAP